MQSQDIPYRGDGLRPARHPALAEQMAARRRRCRQAVNLYIMAAMKFSNAFRQRRNGRARTCLAERVRWLWRLFRGRADNARQSAGHALADICGDAG